MQSALPGALDELEKFSFIPYRGIPQQAIAARFNWQTGASQECDSLLNYLWIYWQKEGEVAVTVLVSPSSAPTKSHMS
jgi:hypothetical protein